MPECFSDAAFLEGYIDAFQSFDASRIAMFYNVPCLSVRPDGSIHSFSNPHEIETFFVSVVEAYKKEGMALFAASDVQCKPKGAMSASLDCTWTMKRIDGSMIRSWQQTYMIQRISSDWKIIASIFHL